MARNFIIGSSQYIDFPKIDTLLGTSYTIAQRFKINAVQSTQLGLANHRSTTDANTAFFHFTILATTGLLRIIIQKDGTNFALVDSSAGPSIGVWHSAIGTRNVDTAELFLDGVSEGSNTSPGSMGTIVSDDYKIGALDSGGGVNSFMDGDIADVAVWSVVLTQNEIDAYNKGVSPNLIRPDKLVSYIPLWGTTQEPDLGGNGGIGTLTNSPAISTTNPPVGSYVRNKGVFPYVSTLFPYVPPVDPNIDFNLGGSYTPPTDPNINFNLQFSITKLQIAELSNKYDVNPSTLEISELQNKYDVNPAILHLSELQNKYDVNPAILKLGELQNKYAVGVAKLGLGELQNKYSIQDAKLEAQLLAKYSIRFAKQFESIFGVTVSKQFLAQAFYSLSTQLKAEYSINTTAKNQLNSIFDITTTTFVKAQFDGIYAIAPITIQLGAPYSIGPVVKVQLDAPWVDTTQVDRQLDSIFDLKTTNSVNKQLKSVYAILTTQIINITGQPTVTLSAEVLEIASADVSIDEGSFIWRATIGILNIEDYVKFNINDEIVLNLYGETFNLVVESKQLSRSGPAELNMSLIAVSPAIKFDFPRADALEISFTSPILAQAAAEQVLGGQDIDWQITDWLIPANRLAIKDGAPIRLVQTIVEAAGGVLESKPDGQLVARHLFPTSLPDFPTASIDQTYTDSSDNLSVSEQFSPTKRLNKFRILDVSSQNRDNMEFDFDDIIDVNGGSTKSKTEGVLRIFPSPFRTNLILRSSRGGEVAFQLIGVATEQREQQVEFKEGFSSLSKPIESIDSVTWEGISLGAVSFAQGDTKISSASVVNLYGLATIKYTTKFLKYKISGIESIDVQFRTEVT